MRPQCANPACTDSVLNSSAGGLPCGDRMLWLTTREGGSLTWTQACSRVAYEFPAVCGICGIFPPAAPPLPHPPKPLAALPMFRQELPPPPPLNPRVASAPSAQPCTGWSGLRSPIEVQPMGCGLVWFLHIGKAGGTTVTSYMREQARVHNLPFHELYDNSKGFNITGWNSTIGWRFIEHEVLNSSRPFALVSQHHTSPGYGSYMLEHVITPWRTKLESKGCRLVTTTLLRSQPSQMMSNLFYNKFDRSRFNYFVDYHSNYQSRYLLFGGNDWPHQLKKQAHEWKSSIEEDLHAPARQVLRTFDHVGRTESLDHFIQTLNRLLGWPVRQQPRWHNLTPMSRKFELTADELERIRERTQVDQRLWESFCEELCSGTIGCTDAVLGTAAGDGEATCRSRIHFLTSQIFLTTRNACTRVAYEFPTECGECATPPASPPPPTPASPPNFQPKLQQPSNSKPLLPPNRVNSNSKLLLPPQQPSPPLDSWRAGEASNRLNSIDVVGSPSSYGISETPVPPASTKPASTRSASTKLASSKDASTVPDSAPSASSSPDALTKPASSPPVIKRLPFAPSVMNLTVPVIKNATAHKSNRAHSKRTKATARNSAVELAVDAGLWVRVGSTTVIFGGAAAILLLLIATAGYNGQTRTPRSRVPETISNSEDDSSEVSDVDESEGNYGTKRSSRAAPLQVSHGKRGCAAGAATGSGVGSSWPLNLDVPTYQSLRRSLKRHPNKNAKRPVTVAASLPPRFVSHQEDLTPIRVVNKPTII
eukprot:CAMPEP_0119302982 /NCGR_PEP_ID=MMETSP1333-20130426/4491_1 /TAXON_ID=418940 /ORGANISM="Scyphosphaera apsteinii, Strain RCC1455" /LENGTH=764 /DNA_ID=CAMNT_0007305525 /DNA_START=61 /DNA_END=2355 /DNA_ORIENTATION=+